MQELFEKPEQYEEMLRQGISLTGNDRHFFIRGRFDFMSRNGGFLHQPKKILDFGCGTGDASAELSRRFPQAEVFGYDPAKNALVYAEQQHAGKGLSFISEEELKSIQFDLIFLNCVLHHIEPEKRQSAVDLLASLLAPGGVIWVFENNPANPGTQWAMYRNPFDKGVVKVWPAELRKMLRTAGLNTGKAGFLFFFPQWLSVFRPIEPFLKGIPLGGQYAICAYPSASKNSA